MQHVGRARRAERDPGHQHDPLAALCDLVAKRHALALLDHLLEARDVARVNGVDAPLQAQPPRRVERRAHGEHRHRRPLARNPPGGGAGACVADHRRSRDGLAICLADPASASAVVGSSWVCVKWMRAWIAWDRARR